MDDDKEVRIIVNRDQPMQHAVEGICNAAAIDFLLNPYGKYADRPARAFADTTDELTVFIVLGEPIEPGSPVAWEAIKGY